jgi:hypothetical protein
MELVHILNLLWRSRALVAVGAGLALLAAIAVGMRGQTTTAGQASAEILIDAQDSALGDLRRDVVPLVARSGIFARFLGADGVTQAIADDAGVREDDIAVVGPKLSVDGVPDEASAERALTVKDDATHLVQVQQGDQLPLLTIFAQAPSEDEARSLANGTAGALQQYVTDYQEEAAIPENRRVTIRQLGTAQAGEVTQSPSAILPVAVFFVVFGLSCLAILAWPRVKESWGSLETAQPAAALNGDSADREPEPPLMKRLTRKRPLTRSLAAMRQMLQAGGLVREFEAEGLGDNGNAENGHPVAEGENGENGGLPQVAREGYCDALRQGGGACHRKAGWGTNHPGSGRCWVHEATASIERLTAAERKATIAAAEGERGSSGAPSPEAGRASDD